jgi:hypothetical protein
MDAAFRPARKEAAIVAFAPRPRTRRGLRFVLPLLILAAAAGTALADDFQVRPYQPAPAPQSMAPPPAPARPPTAGAPNFGTWQKDGSHFRFAPGSQTNDPNQAPIWSPGRWSTDANGNRVYTPGYWR